LSDPLFGSIGNNEVRLPAVVLPWTARGEQDFHRLRSLLYFPVLLQKKHAARGPTRERATKNPARHAARAPGVVSVNMLFWKILVTRVKRKIDLPVSF
jgi:hypothetical protein